MLRVNLRTGILRSVMTATPIVFAFFYRPWPAAAASSDGSMSSADFATVDLPS